MELSLRIHNGDQVQVQVDGAPSHHFALSAIPAGQELSDLGRALYQALFPSASPAQKALNAADRLGLVLLDNELDVLPWECLHSGDGFLALELPIVRLLPLEARIPAPELSATPLRVLAVPSNPVAHAVPPLNIAGEWRRLVDVIQKLPNQARLERVNPPTLDSLRELALSFAHPVIHFMGHGGQANGQALLYFENDSGGLQPVTARDVGLSIKKQAFLVTLNACASAKSGETEFSNLARLLVQRGVPYALGMRFSIPDDAALAFSRALYGNLARGVDVEEAVFQARRSLLRGEKRAWLVAVPVLYSSLAAPAPGFSTPAGEPKIDERQPPLELFSLPRAEGAFQGRVDELLALGEKLTGEPRPKLLTVHGPGGQGKTALAREAAERFAHAWPGGVWAVSLETKPNRATFAFQLAQFLGLPTDQFPQSADLERAILARLNQRRALLVLDNAETFTEAVRANDAEALGVAEFLRESLAGTQAGLLVTSREPLGWPGEQVLALGGLSPQEGAALFQQSAPQRQAEIQLAQAEALSQRMDGHPLALLLLGSAFNESAISLAQFIAEHETRLLEAENRYKKEDHRHRTLYASIETSTRYLSEAERDLLACLWIFRAPFLPETAAAMLADGGESEDQAQARQEQFYEHLASLHRRGLLAREIETLASGKILLYRTLPTVRLFSQAYLPQPLPALALQNRLAQAYNSLLLTLYREMDRSAWASFLALRCREDLEDCFAWQTPEENGWYANILGWVLQRVGDRPSGQAWMEQALELAQGKDRDLELHIINNMALVYSATGNPCQAIELYEQALPLMREVGDRAGEAATLNNIASVYSDTGNLRKGLELLEQALPLMREVGDRVGEATTLSNMAGVYRATDNPRQALELLEQAFAIRREVGDRAGEAATLNNMALVYSATGNPHQALELYEQALPIRREVGDRAGEATTLNNMAMVYSATGNPQKGIELLEQTLHLMREVRNRAGQAMTLNNMAMVYSATGNPKQALELYQQALPITKEVGDRAGEAITCFNMAFLLRDMNQSEEAIKLLRAAVKLEKEVEHPDYADYSALLATWEDAFGHGQPLPGSS